MTKRSNKSRWRRTSLDDVTTIRGKVPGVYVAMSAGRVLYVGSAVTIRGRLLSHRKYGSGRYYIVCDQSAWVNLVSVTVAWREIADKAERRAAEKRLIVRLRPEWNIQHTGRSVARA